jgi:hypothetical protein
MLRCFAFFRRMLCETFGRDSGQAGRTATSESEFLMTEKWLEVHGDAQEDTDSRRQLPFR